MVVRWTVGLLVCAVLGAAAAPASAQDATMPVVTEALPPSAPPAAKHRGVRATYDGTADSTRWSLVTHKGRYVLTIQRPRLAWTGAREGRKPGVPCDELAPVLVSDEATVVVGGIRERLKPDHVRALRYLLDRLEAWPPT